MMKVTGSRLVWVGKGADMKQVRVDLELTVDTDAVFDALARKAAFNKSKKAKEIGGSVTVKVL